MNLRAGVAMDTYNAPIIRQEIARRALAYGISGEGVTDQSGRARDIIRRQSMRHHAVTKAARRGDAVSGR